jgi:hypothetical protein
VRLVLVNVPTPAAVLAEMTSLVRPGGTVAAQEVDWLSWECEPPHPAWTALRALLRELWESQGLDPHIGRRLPQLLRESGLCDVEAMSHAGIDGGDQPYGRLLLTFAERFRSRLIAGGITNPAELDALMDDVARHLDRPGAIVVRALTVQAWGRVPERRGAGHRPL